MDRVKLPCGCVVEGEAPYVHRIWLCHKHLLEEKAKGTPLIADQMMEVSSLSPTSLLSLECRYTDGVKRGLRHMTNC